MAKKYFKKTLSVGLSLALCAGLVAPSFAATFTELQNVIDNEESLVHDDGTKRIDYDNGNVTLYEEVTQVGADRDAGVLAIDIEEGKDIVLDLNGQTVQSTQATGSAVITVNGGNLTLEDNSEDETGTVTGGRYAGVWVNSGSFTMEGGTVTGNNANAVDANKVGGVGVSGEDSTFIMNGGTVTNGKNGEVAVFVERGAEFEMTGGSILAGNAETVKDDGSDVNVAITGGTFSKFDEKYLADGYDLKDNENGTCSVVHPEHIWTEWKTTQEAQVGVVGAQERHCQAEGCNAAETQELPALEPDPVVVPDEPVVIIPDEPVVDIPDEPVIEIDEPAVPLAEGPVTCGEFIDYLWRHEGEPEAESEADVVVDHEYAEAIIWAQSIGIIEVETFEADELVTVGVVRAILSNFAAYSDMVMPELTTLEGDEDEAVLNCSEVLAEFFGENEAE